MLLTPFAVRLKAAMEVNPNLDLKNYTVDPEYVARCRAAKNEVELALVALECVGLLMPQSTPLEPPILAQFREDKGTPEWKQKTAAEKDSIEKKIYGRAEVQAFFEKSQSIGSRNYSNACALEDWMAILLTASKDEEARQFWEVYNHYPDFIKIGQNVIWRKKKKDYAKVRHDRWRD